MSASLPATLNPAQKVRIFPFGTWACVALLCFALQSATCLNRKNPQDCGDTTPCTEEEPEQAGCPQGKLCPSLPPAPCPPGTFLSRVSPHNTPFCHLCPRGFFNPWPGQDACYPCGSVATQPEEGKETCICPGPGQVFQPSDGLCPCLPGYQDVGEPRGCVQREYKSCKDGATWNQEGLCLTKDQWNDHCANEVCATPEDARGYDPGLGLCQCWGQYSSGMCGPPCAERQRHILQLSCSEGIPQISISEDTGSQEFYLLDRPSSPRSVGHPCNLDQRQKPVPLYVVWMDETGFLGLTRPGRELLLALSLPLREPRLPGQGAGKLREGHLSAPWSLSLNSTHLGDLSPPEPGIRNPTVCLQINDTLAFLVTREHYPEYDQGHFYNTLREFDWGRFRALAEESPLHDQSPFLFLHQFQQPGVYVFCLSSNRHRKMYIRTLPPGGQCFGEGPYTSTTPRYLIQTGIARIPRPPKSSDWPGILGEIVLLLGLCLLLLIQCHRLSWARKAAPYPTFRKHQQGYNLDAYTSPRTGMTSVRRGGSHQDSDTPRIEGGHGGSWGTEEQVDLEWFDTETFFGVLFRQSLSVTTKLSQTKEELKLLCLKLVSEAHSLRQLWGAERGIPASTDQILGSPQKERQQAAEEAARAAEEEARQRGYLAGEYAACLSYQLKLLRQDLHARQDQWASFSSVLMAAQRLLKAQTGSRPKKSSQAGQNPKGEVPQLDAVLDQLSQALLQEGHRLKAWGILGTGTGAELLRPASAGPERDADDISVDPITKLMVPGPNCAMLPASGHAGSIPHGYFVHPDTGRVLPEAGNLGYDLQGATLVPTTDFSSGGVRTSEAAILPYVPYPTCPATESPAATRLPILQPRRTSQLGALMTDPITGIEVPVLAVTLHPQTRQWLTLGGTYCNPLTKTLAPLELGSPMEDPVTGGISPILGVGLDENTGQVLALGGLRDASGNLMLPGDNFVEPLSGKTVRLQGASRQEGRTLPHMGGSQALLDANVLVAQRQVIAVLRRYQQRPASRVQRLLEAAIRDMRHALALSLHHVLQQARRLERQLEAAHGIEASGGRIGMMCYPGTELWVPVLYGMEIPDPEGSGLMVPILGMESDGNAADATPLAGSMEDANGKGLVPISIGAQAIDPLTGEPGPVIGAQTDPSTRVVVPIVQTLEALPRGVRGHGLLDTLESELRAREQYWHHQEQEEARLAEHLGNLRQELLSTPGKDARQQLRAVEEACANLESRCLQETERRARALSAQNGPERVLLSQADREEWEQEAQVALGMRKVLQSLGHAAEKLRQAAGRLQAQEEEMWLQKKRNQSPQIWNRPWKVVQHLSDEFQAVVRERQSFLDRALGQLQYQRELSRLQLLHTQIVASGTPVCLENYPGDRFYGTVTTSLRDQAAACPLLIPFLKSVTAALVGAQGHGPGLEHWGPGTDADKVDIMWTLPLFSTLKKVDIWSQVYKERAELQGQVYHKPAPKSSLQDVPKPQITQKEELITVQSTELSAREFVVYQYGLSILHLLIPQLHAPEITLQIASHLPAMEAPDNAFQGCFFYQRAENTLFIERECLASVGSFVLLLIHCLAHIVAEDFHQDSSPAFQRSFYKGLKAYFREAFSITLQISAISQDRKLDQSISAILLEEQPISERGRDLLSKLIERKHESHLEPESSEEYLKKNKDLLLFTNMEHFLKSILAAEQRKPRDQFGGEDKL
ncbi:uncharacterized protein LOC117029780 [Rhinolophus ferrumequinum]|uniref:uncharacterized protein LOC117029780 n=1 Tax=Rhinolophus ferrumequinum TaxID=59479 RepID=UPI00140FA59A|nr:uncharacterized protein LOC117029780 [Rhinolophus ferrumequinum]